MANPNSNHGVSRRACLKATAGSGILALAGCVGGGGENSDEGETEGDVQFGGQLEYSFHTGPDDLNPLHGTGRHDMFVGDWMYSKLTVYNYDEQTVEPDLAQDWEQNEAADEWTFSLREDAIFPHNDEAVLAEDVKASLDAIRSEDIAPAVTDEVGPIESTEIIDDHTVGIQLTQSFVNLPIALSDGYTNILPKAVIEGDYDRFSSEDFGSGPFVLEEYEIENSYEFTANEDYYQEDDEGNQLPYVDGVTLNVEPDSLSEFNALQDGRLDIIHDLTAENFAQAEADSNIEAINAPGGRILPICLTTTIEPLDDVRVRQAMKYAVDKNEMLQALEYGELAQDTPVSEFHTQYAELEPEFGFESDYEAAQEQLEEAGYSDGFDLPTLYYISDIHPVHESIALLFQEQMAELNIEFDVSNISSSNWISDVWNTEDNWYVSNWSIGLDIGTHLQLTAHSEGAQNEMKWSNDEFDEALEQARAATDEETQLDHLETAQRILRDEGGWIVPFTVDRLTATQSRVENLSVGTTREAFVEDVYLTN